MIVAQVESFGQTLAESKQVFPLHYQMLALNKDKVPLEPDYLLYLKLEQMGELSFITLRDGGKLVGYWLCHVRPEPHYMTCLASKMDIFFVLPDYRQGVASLILMRAVEREMRRRGVSRWWAGEKLHAPCGRLFQVFGFAPVETNWSKWIGE